AAPLRTTTRAACGGPNAAARCLTRELPPATAAGRHPHERAQVLNGDAERGVVAGGDDGGAVVLERDRRVAELLGLEVARLGALGLELGLAVLVGLQLGASDDVGLDPAGLDQAVAGGVVEGDRQLEQRAVA